MYKQVYLDFLHYCLNLDISILPGQHYGRFSYCQFLGFTELRFSFLGYSFRIRAEIISECFEEISYFHQKELDSFWLWFLIFACGGWYLKPEGDLIRIGFFSQEAAIHFYWLSRITMPWNICLDRYKTPSRTWLYSDENIPF